MKKGRQPRRTRKDYAELSPLRICDQAKSGQIPKKALKAFEIGSVLARYKSAKEDLILAYRRQIAAYFVDACEAKDAAFFEGLAQLCRTTTRTNHGELIVDPVDHAVALYSVQTGLRSGISLSDLVRFVAAKLPKFVCDERTIRRSALAMGLSFRSPGRPKKTGT